MKKNHNLHIKLTSEQKSKLKHNAEKLGLSLSSYCLLVLLSTNPRKIQLINNSSTTDL